MLESTHIRLLEMDSQDCPGGPVVKNLPANGGGMGPIPDWETKILHDTQYGWKIEKKVFSILFSSLWKF